METRMEPLRSGGSLYYESAKAILSLFDGDWTVFPHHEACLKIFDIFRPLDDHYNYRLKTEGAGRVLKMYPIRSTYESILEC